ncbi:MAG: hypothetical protein ACRDBO_11955, partial [Lachnospiraceae bacterium]
ELSVKVININLPENHPILEACRPLYEYSWFIQQIKEYLNAGSNRDDAITRAIHDCLEAGIMRDFLVEHGTEAVNMLFTEFKMEDALEVRFEEGVETGIEQGIEQGKMRTMKDLVEKKLAKGKTLEIIAEELEEDVDTIETIIASN